MKKVFLTIAFLAVAFCANAGWFVAGDLSFGFSNKKTPSLNFSDRTVSFGINPAFGYVFKGKFGVALALGYGNSIENISKMEETLNVKEEIIGHNWKISPFFRYIICNFNDKICFYTDLAFKMTSADFSSRISDINVKTKSSKQVLSVELAPAMSYALTNNLSLFAKFHFLTLGYYHTVEKAVVETIENQFDFGANNQTLISAGLVYIFK